MGYCIPRAANFLAPPRANSMSAYYLAI